MKSRLGRLVVFAPPLVGAAALATTWSLAALPQAARVVATAFLGVALLVAALGSRPEVRSHATVALAAAGVTAAGQARTGRAYVAICVAFALVAVLSIRLGRGTAVPRYAGPRRALGVLPAVGAAVALALALGLPPLARWVENRVGLYGEPEDARVGFSSRLALGSTQGMLQSNRIVLRVHGERADYLRGALLDRYDGRVWASTLADRSQAARLSAREDQTTARVVFASGAPIAKPPETRWFLPANACNIHTSSGRVLVDGMGIATPETPGETEVGFSPCDRPELAPPGPSDTDLDVPAFMRRTIDAIAAQWTQGAETDRAKVDAIARELQRYGYSLWVERGRGDPIVDFLTVHKEGHCEMFASALALLARARGVPTRVVTGYRVTEVSPLFGHAVVRERNAHAWVEAWVDGAWRAWDPTPGSEIMARARPSVLDRASEVAAYLWDAGLDRALGAALLLAAIAYYGRQWLVGLFARLRARGGARAGSSLPAFATLEESLARAGHARPASEPLERFAHRLAAAGEPWGDDVAAALGTYARLRYGGEGDEAEVARGLERAASRVATSARAPRAAGP